MLQAPRALHQHVVLITVDLKHITHFLGDILPERLLHIPFPIAVDGIHGLGHAVDRVRGQLLELLVLRDEVVDVLSGVGLSRPPAAQRRGSRPE